MADQVKLAAENSVSIVGRLADVDVRTGVDKGNKEYVSIKASVVSSLQGKDNIFKIRYNQTFYLNYDTICMLESTEVLKLRGDKN